jgi:alcohol dehydrogenase
MAVAREGIARLRAFYRSLGLPGQLSEVGIGDEDFDEIADKSLSSDGTQGHFVKLSREDILNILNMAK